MKSQGKVIPLRTTMTAAYNVLSDDHGEEHWGGTQDAHILNKALCVLKEMEEEWEADHSSVGIRDKIHLLAYYLGRLPRS